VAEPAAGRSLSGRDPGAAELDGGRQRAARLPAMFRQRLSAAVSASEAGTGLRFLASYTLVKAIDNTSGGDEFHFSTILGNQLENG
jgi:hypothetical protein